MVLTFNSFYFRRVESAHARLKNLLQDCMGDFCTVWEAVSACLKLQHDDIRGSFQKSIYVVEHRHNIPLYSNLRGFVSRNAMELIGTEVERVKYVGIDKSLCGCVHRTSLGLPCACELARYSMMPSPIPLDAVHIFWRILTFRNECFSQSTSLSIRPEVDIILHRFEELDVPGKVDLKSKLREIAIPHTTQLVPPPSKVKTKGAPRRKGKTKANTSKHERSTKRDPSFWERVDSLLGCSDKKSIGTQSPVCKVEQPIQLPYMEWIPPGMHPFVANIVDVQDDRNCGYRAIGALLGRTEASWPQIRRELTTELQEWFLDYSILFGGVEQVNKWIDSLTVVGEAQFENWMTLPEMGPVIASRYNVALVSLSLEMSLTYFPLRGLPPHGHTLIALCFVNHCHWVQVFHLL